MSTVPPPQVKEVQEFQFKLLARLRIFKNFENVPLKLSLSLIATASKFGLIFVGTPLGFDVIQTAKVIELCAGIKKPSAEVTNFPRRHVTLNAQPSHLDISCNGQHLAVGFSVNDSHVVRIYDVSSFTALTERVVHELRLPAYLQALSWNPGIPNLLAACMQDGSAHVYEFKNNSFDISSIPVESQSTCLCWSPKGKQIVIGSRNGALNQFKPDLKIVKVISPPQGEVSVASVQWLSNFQYAAVYCAEGSGASLVIINTPKNQPPTYINYEDITYSNGNNRLIQFYFIHQLAWNVLVVASANSMEVGVLGLQRDWEQWQLEDAARAELPFSPSRQETYPIGMALDTSVQFNLPWGENQQLPPMPLLLLLSHEGVLVMYWTVNLLPGASIVCEPPTSLPDTSGLHLFIPADPQVIQQNERTSPQAKVLVSPQSIESSVSSTLQPASFATLSPAPTTPPWQRSSTATVSQPAWIATSTSTFTSPKAEIKPPPSLLQSSSATVSTDTSAFMTSVTQSAFSASPSFGMTSSTTTSYSHSASVTVPSQIPFDFNAPQASSTNLFSKPGYVSSSVPASISLSLPTTSVAPQVQIETPAVPSPVPSPVSVPSTPEHVIEETQELKAMNDAILQDAIRDEIAQFSQELRELSRKVLSLQLKRIKKEDMQSTTVKLNELNSFIYGKDGVKVTTAAQYDEVDALRSFLVDTFAYVDSMKTRIHLQNNSDYSSIRCPQGLDPIMAKKLRDIKSNVMYLETQLPCIHSEIASKWDLFQEGSKENRNVMQYPSIEAIYQTMMMYSSLIMKHKTTLDNLEAKIVIGSRKRLSNLFNMSQTIGDNHNTNKTKDAAFSKIRESFLSLNLGKSKRETRIEDLQKSVHNLDISEHSKLSNTGSHKKESSFMELVEEIFGDRKPRYLHCNNQWLPVSPQLSSSLPVVTSTSQTGSISSGQPVIQNSVLKTSSGFKKTNQTPTMNMRGINRAINTESVKSIGKSNLKSPCNMNLVATSTVFSAGNANRVVAQASMPSFNFGNSYSKQSETSFKNAPNSNFPTVSASLCQREATSSIVKNPQAAQMPNISFTTIPLSVNTQKTTFVVSKPDINKDLSVRPSPFSSSFSVNSPQVPNSTLPQSSTTAFGKTNIFSTSMATTSTVTPTFVPSFIRTEPAKSISAVKTPLNITSAGQSPASYSALSSLSSLVSGIEPLESATSMSESQKTQVSSETSNIAITSRPFVFSVSNSSETNSTTGVKGGISTQKTNVLEISMENKPEIKETVDSELKEQLSGTLKISSISSQPKSMFGGTPASLLSETKSEKTDQVAKSSFSFTSTPTTVFDTKTRTSSQSQKSPFTETSSNVISTIPELQTKPREVINIGDSQSHVGSPIIEVSLTPNKNVGDTKSTLERFSASKNITITRIESPEIISIPSEGARSQSDSTSSSLFGSLNMGSLATPAKSQNIFESSAPVKPIVMYEATTSKLEDSTDSEKKEGSKLVETHVQAETKKTQHLFGGTAVTTSTPPSSFTFSTSTLQNISMPTENTLSNQNSGFSFTSTSTPSTNAAIPAPQTTSFSFAQTAVSQPSSSAFSFATPITSTPTTSASIFGFGNLPVGFSEDKSKSLLFEQQSKSAVSSSTSIFGGISSKPSDTAVIFGQNTVTLGENKNVFGQAQPYTVEKKTVFGQANTNTEDNNIFGQTTSNTAETKNTFVQSTPTSGDNKSVFDKTSSGTEESKSIFGQAATTGEKSVFGHASGSTVEGKNIFGQTITTTAENKNVFGQIPSNTGESKSVFEQTTATTATENKSIFGQAPGITSSGQSEFSFSLSTSTATSQSTFFGSPATTSASFFGQTICSPVSTATSAFGQPTTTPVFGSTACSPFGGTTTSSPFSGTTTFGTKPSFGQSGGSFFGQGSGGFGSSGGSLFGGGSSIGASPVFGSSQPASPFGQSSGGSIFGGGSFTTGSQSVGQTGFGTPAFQNKPAFGSTSPPAFGAAPAFGGAPTFGGSAAFGSPPKPFGGALPSSSSAFGGSSQQSSTFENLANQNTMTFGNLAQNQSSGFGSSFGSPTPSATSTTAFPPVTTSSVFGGSSFSNWR